MPPSFRAQGLQSCMMSPPEKTGYSKKVQEPRDEQVEMVQIEGLLLNQSEGLPVPSITTTG